MRGFGKLSWQAVAVAGPHGGGSSGVVGFQQHDQPLGQRSSALQEWQVASSQHTHPKHASSSKRPPAPRPGRSPPPPPARLLPSLDAPEPWSHLTRALYQHLTDLPIVWSRAASAGSRGGWLAPSAALFSDAAVQSSPQLRDVLVDALGLPLACGLPAAAEAALLRGTRGAAAVSPSLARQHLQRMARGPAGAAELARLLLAHWPAAAAAAAAKGSSSSTEAAAADGSGKGGGGGKQHLEEAGTGPAPASSAAAVLLQYCLSDLSACRQHPQQLQRLQQELDGLPLLPLADGTLGRLQAAAAPGSNSGQGAATSKQQQQQARSGAALTVYVLPASDTEQRLLSCVPGACLAADLAPELLQGLAQAAELGAGPGGQEQPGQQHKHCFASRRISDPYARCTPYLARIGVLHAHQTTSSALRDGSCVVVVSRPSPPSPTPCATGLFNVRRLSAALLDSELLQHLLPPEWQGVQEVEWAAAPPSAAVAAGAADATANSAASEPAAAAAAPGQHEQQQQGQPSAQWLQLLWAWLSERKDVLQLASWPVLPIQGGRLVRLQQHSQVRGSFVRVPQRPLAPCIIAPHPTLSSCSMLLNKAASAPRAASPPLLRPSSPPRLSTVTPAPLCVAAPQVLREGELTEAVSSALRRCGCRLLDASLLPPLCPALDLCVQQPGLPGVLAALLAAQAQADTNNRAHGGLVGPGPAVQQRSSAGATAARGVALVAGSREAAAAAAPGTWAERVAGLAVVQRRQLRSYLLQTRWFAGAWWVVKAQGPPRAAWLSVACHRELCKAHTSQAASRHQYIHTV